MIYPKSNKPKGEPKMVQISGTTGEVEAALYGKERIYSRQDTANIIERATNAKTTKDFISLGKYIYTKTKEQDSRPPEYTNS